MASAKLIRLLVVVNLAVFALAVVTAILGDSFLPQPLQQYLAQEAEMELTPIQLVTAILAILVFVALVVSTIGLFRLRPWSRRVFLVANVGLLLVVPFFGPYVTTGLGSVLESASSTISGAILALIYWSPACSLFDAGDNAA